MHAQGAVVIHTLLIVSKQQKQHNEQQHYAARMSFFSAQRTSVLSSMFVGGDVFWERALASLPAALTLALRDAELDVPGVLLNYPRTEPTAMKEVLKEVLDGMLGSFFWSGFGRGTC